MIKKQETYWVVLGPLGGDSFAFVNSMRYNRNDSIATFVKNHPYFNIHGWKKALKNGFRCKKVTINIVEK